MGLKLIFNKGMNNRALFLFLTLLFLSSCVNDDVFRGHEEGITTFTWNPKKNEIIAIISKSKVNPDSLFLITFDSVGREIIQTMMPRTFLGHGASEGNSIQFHPDSPQFFYQY